MEAKVKSKFMSFLKNVNFSKFIRLKKVTKKIWFLNCHVILNIYDVPNFTNYLFSKMTRSKTSAEPDEFTLAFVCSSSLCLSTLSIGTQSDVVIKVRLQWKLNCWPRRLASGFKFKLNLFAKSCKILLQGHPWQSEIF